MCDILKKSMVLFEKVYGAIWKSLWC